MINKVTISLFFLLLTLGLIACIGSSEDYTAASFSIEGEDAIMTGVIDGTTPDEVRDLIDDYPEVTTIVMLEVDGSADDSANVVAARLVRKHGFNTHLPADGSIASGGVDFFLAGVERTAEEGGKMGVHSWAGDGITGDELAEDDPEHQLYLDYYAEMGIPADFYWFTLEAAPAEDIHNMSLAEMAQYQMTTE